MSLSHLISRIIPHRGIFCVLAVFAASFVAGCAELPRDVADPKDVRGGATAQLAAPEAKLPYALVNLSGDSLSIANAVNTPQSGSFSGLPSGRQSAARVSIAVGDILSVTVFEATAGGLFIPADAGTRSGNFVQIPNQQVDISGTVDIPYAGAIRAAGRSTREVSEEIRRKLANRAIEPQVVVSINERRGNDVSVLGEVNNPARFTMDPGGIRLMSAIARAGGPRYPTHETLVSIQRGGKRYSAQMSSVLRNPSQDVQLQSGDVVFLSREPRYFMAFGATPEPNNSATRRITFENDEMSLAEGLAKAGGLRTERADPNALFIFRVESRHTLARMGVDVSSFGETVPTVYAVNLRSAEGVFLSDRFKLRHRDIMIAADASSVDLTKLLTVVNQVVAVPYSVAMAAK